MPHKVGEVYFTGSEEPNKFVDISETFMLKMKAISCHVSQLVITLTIGRHGSKEEESRLWPWEKNVAYPWLRPSTELR